MCNHDVRNVTNEETGIDMLSSPLFARTLFIHAHPDDEAIQAGGLTAALCKRGHKVAVVTCTRGEEGEAVPGILPDGATEKDLVVHREKELVAARKIFGVDAGFWLGAGERIYRDSGMRWVSQGVAGPAENVSPHAFSVAPFDEEIRDALAVIHAWKPTVIVGYDSAGSYGHPDHKRAHELALECARESGLPFVEIASEEELPGFTYVDTSEYASLVYRALRCYESQLTVVEAEEKPYWQIRHVGGQFQEAPLFPGLRRALN